MRNYLQFLLKSKNEHGVHSPFVFDFLTKCLYQYDYKQNNLLKEKKLSKKTTQAIFRIFQYFKPKTLCFFGEELKNHQLLFNNINLVKNENLQENLKIDAFFINKLIDLKDFENILTKIHNDSFGLLLLESNTLWQEIKKHPKVKVTLDCYCFMMIFFRKEQPKQDFLIRF